MSFTHANKRGKYLRKKSKASKFIPWVYQYECIKFGIKKPEAGFFLAPGLGKTMIILMIFKILKKLGLVDELLVLAKRRICYEVWPEEIEKWKLPFKYVIVHGGVKKRTEALYAKADIRIMNYDSLDWWKEEKAWFRRDKRVMLCVDESSKLRNTKTVRFKSLKSRLPFFKRRYILTGSPAPAGLMGLFGQTYVLDLGETFGPYITHFRNEYFMPAGFKGYGYQLLPGAEQRIFKALRPLVIRYGNDELDLPPITFIDKKITLPKKAMRQYKTMEKEFILEYRQGNIVAANAAVASGKLRQIANGGAFYTPDGEIATVDSKKHTRKWRRIHDEKCAQLVELLEELNGEPALVAVEYRHDKERIQKYLRKHAKQFANAPFVDAGMKDAEFSKLKKRWDKGELPVMFGNPSSIAHGLNLQGKGGIVIFFALTWNLEDYEQFIQRVWRQGQKRRVLVYRIIARDTVDEDMVHSLKVKDHNQQTLLKAMEVRHGLRRKKKTQRQKEFEREFDRELRRAA
jgi:SNF2 family DNA or RNA helicase